MTTRDIARVAAKTVRAETVELDLGEDETYFANPDTRAMLQAAALAARQAMCDFPVVKKQVFSVDGSRYIAFDGFAVPPFRVFAVKDLAGENVGFSLDAFGIKADRSGELAVEYAAPPAAEVAIDAELAIGQGIDLAAAAYLAACHYCVMTGRTEEANFYSAQYDDAVSAVRTRRRARLPNRKFK